jgi:subtilisin family serine protease
MTNQNKIKIKLYSILLTGAALWSLTPAIGQGIKKNNWQHLDPQRDSVMGISAYRAYGELLRGGTGVPVIVAIIDGGLDTSHRDFQGLLWRNPREIPGNGKDDDHNGYTDDVHGWNFLGSAKGSFQYDNLDLVRQLRTAVKVGDRRQGARFREELAQKRASWRQIREASEKDLDVLRGMLAGISNPSPQEKDFRAYRYKSPAEQRMLLRIVAGFKQGLDFGTFRDALESRYRNAMEQLDYWQNPDYDPRKDKAFRSPFYGNGDVQGPVSGHATHVAGIIAAKGVSPEGGRGIAQNVRLMVLRTVPTGDYLDEELALAIRYAADQGAKVINVSIGKSTALRPELIDAAVQYAMDKDVLIVHAAGNLGKLIEQGAYPKKNYQNGGQAKAWIEVGASGMKDDSSLLFGASNYGKTVVDVFAPGVAINSCTPSNGYAYLSGTSMAAPVVSGMAAVLRSYYPQLSAVQVRQIILESVTKVNHLIKTPQGSMLPFSETCASGGIVNLYNAIQSAEKMTNTK